MSTILRQRSNLVPNPRGAGESPVFDERRRNLYPNPRLKAAGAALTPYTFSGTGTVTRSYNGTVAGSPYPLGIGTARQVTADALGTTGQAGDYIDVPAAAGKTYTASVYARRLAGSLTKRVRLMIEPRSATAALTGTASALTPTLTDTVIRRLSATLTAPAGTTVLRVYVLAEGTGTGLAESVTVDWSCALLEETQVVRPWFDGSLAASGPYELYGWVGTADTSASTLLSRYVSAADSAGAPVTAAQPLGWRGLASDSNDVRASWYKWIDGPDNVVRLQLLGGGSTAGPVLYPDNVTGKGATFSATLLIEARREATASPSAALTLTHNGTPVAVPAIGDTWTTVRVPLTLVGGGGQDSLNVLRIGKTGTEAVLIRAVALVDEANYAGPYFDGSTPTVGILDSVWTDPTEAPNSSSYQGIPSLTVTAAAEPAGVNYPPRVRLDVADVDSWAPVRSLTLHRVDSSGRRTPVRSATGDVVELPEAATGTAVTLYDYEAPLGSSSSYVVADDVPSIPSARVTPDDTSAWLIHPGVPARSRRLSVVRLGRRLRRVVEGIYDVVGRADPIVRTDGRRKSAESELVLRTYTDADREALDLLLDDATALLLSVPAGKRWGLVYEWVAISDVEEDRVADTGTWPRRVWRLPYRVVGRPIGGTRAARTWHDVADEAVSWRELARRQGVTSWRDVADPVTEA